MNNSQQIIVEYTSSYERTSFWLNTMVLKMIALTCISLWMFALIIAWNSPATGYEASIYSSTPLIFWIANVINLAVGTGFIIQQVSSRNKRNKSFYRTVGLSLVVLSFASVLSLWIVRGYMLFSQNDSLTHLGIINQLIASGHFDIQNFYPITHVYLAEFSILLNVSSDIFLKTVPFIFALFNVIFVYCFARAVLPRKSQAILTTLIWMTFLSQWYIDLTPNMLANFILPLGLFILVKCLKSYDFQWKVFFGIFIFLLPVLHTLVGFIMAAIMISIWITYKFILKNRVLISGTNSNFLLFSTFALLIWNCIWISSYNLYQSIINNITSTFSSMGSINLDRMIIQAQYATSYNYNIFDYFLKIYGGPTLVLLIAIFGFIYLLRKKRKNEGEYLVILFIAPIIIITLSFIALYLQVTVFPPERLIVYILLFCTLFSSIFLYNILFNFHIIKYKFQNILLGSIVIFIIMFLFINDGLKLYPSPYTYQPAMQVTKTELSGMNWFIFNKDITKQETSLTVRTYRFGSLFLTPEEQKQRPDMKYYTANIPDYLMVPYHFGYENNKFLGQYYLQGTYMVLSGECRAYYKDIYPEMANLRFKTTDFAKLEEDPTVNKLYSNTGLDIYYINPLSS